MCARSSPYAGVIRIRFEGYPRCRRVFVFTAAGGLSVPYQDSPRNTLNVGPIGARVKESRGASVMSPKQRRTYHHRSAAVY